MPPAFLKKPYLIYIVVALAAILSTLFVYFLIQREYSIQYDAQLQRISKASTALIAHLHSRLSDIVHNTDAPTTAVKLQKVIDEYEHIEDVLNIRVTRSDRTVIAALNHNNLGKPETMPLMLAALNGQGGIAFDKAGVRSFCIAMPIYRNGNIWGAIALYHNLEPMYETLNRAHEDMTWATGFTFSILFALIAGSLWFALNEIDKTQTKEAKQARLALIGTMATTVAHEIKNPLNALSLNVQNLKRVAEQRLNKLNDEAFHTLSLMRYDIERLERIIRDFTDLARPPQLQIKAVSLDRTVKQVVRLLTPLAAQKNVALNYYLQTPDTRVLADSQRIEQVLITLVKNAIESVSAQGKVEIKTSLSADNKFLIEVSDNGPDVPSSQHALIFEPFHSTKRGGTGLALYLSKRLVEAHQGILSVSSDEKQGAVFRVSLPLATEPGSQQEVEV